MNDSDCFPAVQPLLMLLLTVSVEGWWSDLQNKSDGSRRRISISFLQTRENKCLKRIQLREVYGFKERKEIKCEPLSLKPCSDLSEGRGAAEQVQVSKVSKVLLKQLKPITRGRCGSGYLKLQWSGMKTRCVWLQETRDQHLPQQ